MDLLDSHVPAGAKTHLKWASRADILHAMRGTMRFRKWGDVFAGTGGFGASCINIGMRNGFFYDAELNPKLHDLTTDLGLAALIQLTLELLSGAQVVFGVPCSTFVFLSRGTSQRDKRSGYVGDTARTDVCNANTIAWRVIFLVQVLLLRLVEYIIEQPLTSCFFFAGV